MFVLNVGFLQSAQGQNYSSNLKYITRTASSYDRVPSPSQQLYPLPRPFQTTTSHAHMTTFSKGSGQILVAEALRPHRLSRTQRKCTKPSGKHSANRVLSERPLRDISSYGGRRRGERRAAKKDTEHEAVKPSN
ncbi:hypothetical protein ATANTOWER_030585 [Ataeniobius toweri]|uniref:Uncharacterized protein n=1 Tax=Ataeniobius toweri TaxID=208326 RepID=A0ABU7BCK6_9TELE|nr:hypothetical protein [Ataeniobius toweri]